MKSYRKIYKVLKIIKNSKNVYIFFKNFLLNLIYYKKKLIINECFSKMKVLSEESCKDKIYATALIAGIFDNPAYWFRISLV